jgi:hypothetical protein
MNGASSLRRGVVCGGSDRCVKLALVSLRKAITNHQTLDPMRNLSTFALLSLLSFSTHAQNYCSPTFVNGCALWRNQSISIGSIDWTLGVTDCAVSDYTSLVTDITPGVPTPMIVVNGNWCGCAVWVDLDQSTSFEDSENLYYTYVGGDPSYTYDFDITIPANTPPGQYRMRVIAPWGSDGVSVGANGYGPCGAYQYGNFDDFTLNVSGNTGIASTAISNAMIVGPNPTEGLVTIDTKGLGLVQRAVIWSVDGRRMMELPLAQQTGPVQLDLTTLPAGLYTVQCIADGASYTVQVIKR